MPTAPVVLNPNDSLPRPSWWDGPCDVGNNGISNRLTANFDGLQACGPGSGQSGEDFEVHFFEGAWGEFEWECVELAMRWMYLAWGAAPYGANGNTVVSNYPNGQTGWPAVRVIRNGARFASPEPGDVLSIDNGDAFGHAEVVSSSNVNSSGDGTITAVTENFGATNDGWISLNVSDWTVTDGVPGDTVLGWLHNPAWSAQLPVMWQLAKGALQIENSGTTSGTWATVATGIADAEVIGGTGWEPEPIVVALTTKGELEAGYYMPGRALSPVAKNVTSFAVSVGPGASGKPLLGWRTATGDFEVASGSFTARPLLEATGARSIAIAPGSGPSDAFVGYMSGTGVFFDKAGTGALASSKPWVQVAKGVTSIAIAGGNRPTSEAVEGLVKAGGFYARYGMAGTFARQATGVKRIAVATDGLAGTPVLAYVSTAGALEAEVVSGTNPTFVEQAASGIAGVSLDAGPTSAGYPFLGATTATGAFEVEEGVLNGRFTSEGTGDTAAGVAAFTVS